jgi:ATP-dependent DNA helicase RecG
MKAAQGRDRRGEVRRFRRSYRAMANAEGGAILLGVQEKPRGTFKAVGIVDVERVRDHAGARALDYSSRLIAVWM